MEAGNLRAARYLEEEGSVAGLDFGKSAVELAELGIGTGKLGTEAMSLSGACEEAGRIQLLSSTDSTRHAAAKDGAFWWKKLPSGELA